MPEGDSIAKDASRLRPVLVGEEIVAVHGTAAPVRSNSRRLVGETVEAVRTVGKHLVIDASSGYSVHVHRGMSGRWRIMPADLAVPGSARLTITTASHHVCCFSAPKVEVDRTPAIDLELKSLGPDLLAAEFDPRVFVERARRRSGPIADILLDQRVVAGVGNVYKSEVLFLSGVHPSTRVEDVADDKLAEIADRAARLLGINVRAGARVTTADRAHGRELWVYQRTGYPCRRCATAIEQSRLGGRATYWCPSCQQPVD